MATATGEGNILAADAEVAALERCLKVLKTAKSDTEIFAALLLVSWRCYKLNHVQLFFKIFYQEGLKFKDH